MNAKEWIMREDAITQADRIERLKWMLGHTPENEIWLFHSGIISKRLFEQMRYCFVYGQYLATIFLGVSFFEHTLAALFFGSGRNDFERASFSVLIKEAFSVGWLDAGELNALEEARKLRNDLTHFRKPLDESSLDYKTLGDPVAIENYLESSARKIMLIVFDFINRTSVR